MADLTGSTFKDAVVPTPGGGSDWGATSGGFAAPNNAPGGAGLSGVAFTQAVVSAPAEGAKETANSLSGLPTAVTTIAVEGAPGVGATVPQPSLMEPRKVAD